jgi:hypothetical protein
MPARKPEVKDPPKSTTGKFTASERAAMKDRARRLRRTRVRLQRQGEPRRRRHVADRLRAEGDDRRHREEDRRAGQEGGSLSTWWRPLTTSRRHAVGRGGTAVTPVRHSLSSCPNPNLFSLSCVFTALIGEVKTHDPAGPDSGAGGMGRLRRARSAGRTFPVTTPARQHGSLGVPASSNRSCRNPRAGTNRPRPLPAYNREYAKRGRPR